MRTVGDFVIRVAWLPLFLVVAGVTASAAELRPHTVAAFDRYVALTEMRMDGPAPPLRVDSLPDARRTQAQAELKAGRTWIEALQTRDGEREVEVADGLVHHWTGTIFLPGARVGQVVGILQDYERHSAIYAPVVQQSKLLSRDGDRFRMFLRFYQRKGITVIVNSEHDARFVTVSPRHVTARIRSTRVAEVEDAGTPQERELPVGRDGGYLWRLYTYWQFVERDGGVYLQCESITLTRGIPTGLGWLIKGFVTSIPRESLVFTLEMTRKALQAAHQLG